MLLAGKQPDGVRHANFFDQRIQRVVARLVRNASSSFLFTRPNADCMLLTCGSTSKAVLPVVAQYRTAPVKQRIAGRQHDDFVAGFGDLLHRVI